MLHARTVSYVEERAAQARNNTVYLPIQIFVCYGMGEDYGVSYETHSVWLIMGNPFSTKDPLRMRGYFIHVCSKKLCLSLLQRALHFLKFTHCLREQIPFEVVRHHTV